MKNEVFTHKLIAMTIVIIVFGITASVLSYNNIKLWWIFLIMCLAALIFILLPPTNDK